MTDQEKRDELRRQAREMAMRNLELRMNMDRRQREADRREETDSEPEEKQDE